MIQRNINKITSGIYFFILFLTNFETSFLLRKIFTFFKFYRNAKLNSKIIKILIIVESLNKLLSALFIYIY